MLFAGGTVVAAILGLWVSGVPFVGLAASAAAIVVLVAIVAAVTLLPALLGLLGHRIDRLRSPVSGTSRIGRTTSPDGRTGSRAGRRA